MGLSIVLALLQLVLPAIQALPTETNHPIFPNSECELDLQVLTPRDIEGAFETDNDLVIKFRALL